jgi:opacity protein-like surface antigen
VKGRGLTVTFTEVRARSGERASPYHGGGIRLGAFSREHGNVFAGSDRAEAGDDNGTKFVTMALVEGVEMIVEVD